MIHYIKFGGELTPQRQKIFYTPSYQTEVGSHTVYVKGISMISLLRKPLGTGNYDLKMNIIDKLFLTYTTIPLYRGVLGITI